MASVRSSWRFIVFIFGVATLIAYKKFLRGKDVTVNAIYVFALITGYFIGAVYAEKLKRLRKVVPPSYFAKLTARDFIIATITLSFVYAIAKTSGVDIPNIVVPEALVTFLAGITIAFIFLRASGRSVDNITAMFLLLLAPGVLYYSFNYYAIYVLFLRFYGRTKLRSMMKKIRIRRRRRKLRRASVVVIISILLPFVGAIMSPNAVAMTAMTTSVVPTPGPIVSASLNISDISELFSTLARVMPYIASIIVRGIAIAVVVQLAKYLLPDKEIE